MVTSFRQLETRTVLLETIRQLCSSSTPCVVPARGYPAWTNESVAEVELFDTLREVYTNPRCVFPIRGQNAEIASSRDFFTRAVEVGLLLIVPTSVVALQASSDRRRARLVIC